MCDSRPSGRTLSVDEMTEDGLIEIVKFEQELRMSDHYQEMYRAVHEGRRVLKPGMLVEDILQLNVLDHFGYVLTEENRHALRILYGMHRKNPRVAQHGFWLHMNTMTEGLLLTGSDAQDCALYTLSEGENTCTLLQYYLDRADVCGVLLVVFAGSIS